MRFAQSGRADLAPERHTLVRCQHCDLIFVDPLSNADQVECFNARYAPEAIEHGAGSAEAIHDQFLEEAHHLQHYGIFGELLDIGHGYEFFLQAMQSVCTCTTGVVLSTGGTL